ncbi:RNA pseudouridine synthase [Helicobacter sp. MIT 99-5507]|uniref:pseudouridine synthase family protein n=1 Tax=Helicobacter sp. MIT 99-5507 TaxID=152489 RepID=UPI000E1EE1A3|nr:RluA family pseudouridine synthase [Helicobacter sp. MIT 99-5507]RDU57995.1 RNA pseudouridine synthase [Helicobacter sp. MIT 99-5507]
MDKAYKILSLRENISNRKAKEMLDLGLVFSSGKKIRASDLISPKTPLKILSIEKPKVLFEDKFILAVSKPPFFDSYDLEKKFSNYKLLNRLDKHTSGVILLTRDDDFKDKVINEFKNELVYKEYLALAKGIIPQDLVIDRAILTTKGNYAKSKIDDKLGKKAITNITPLKLINKNTLLKVVIKTGRTHQIRLHLDSINHPILGDNIYGRVPFARLMLHSYKISLFDYEFCSDEGSFWKYLQD